MSTALAMHLGVSSVHLI